MKPSPDDDNQRRIQQAADELVRLLHEAIESGRVNLVEVSVPINTGRVGQPRASIGWAVRDAQPDGRLA
jgi:hypothetical protein